MIEVSFQKTHNEIVVCDGKKLFKGKDFKEAVKFADKKREEGFNRVAFSRQTNTPSERQSIRHHPNHIYSQRR